ncbi:784_t:CDS:2 [Ambispora gerdemannii]|uniref:784_t:CDS:1 n=1 Tax=Ambispora gerdemannii TaxID=144530 RepID=A0A9N8VGH7_9GLOM|nr:784_t:CDS:2 [Ambispora gerdemannii]
MAEWLNENFGSSEDDSDGEFVPNNLDGEEDDDNSDTSSSSSSDDPSDSSYTTAPHGKRKRGNGKKATPTTNGRGGRKGKMPAKVRKTVSSHNVGHSSQMVIGNGETSCEATPKRNGNSVAGIFEPDSLSLKKLFVPFPIFSDTFKEFHEAQESEYKRLLGYEREFRDEKDQLQREINDLKSRADQKKNLLKTISNDNELLKQKIDTLHETLKPVFNQLIGIDKLDGYTVGPFLLEFGRQIREGTD